MSKKLRIDHPDGTKLLSKNEAKKLIDEVYENEETMKINSMICILIFNKLRKTEILNPRKIVINNNKIKIYDKSDEREKFEFEFEKIIIDELNVEKEERARNKDD
ncbi:MAG: hypothetical protein ACOCT9_02170 [archaeon]